MDSMGLEAGLKREPDIGFRVIGRELSIGNPGQVRLLTKDISVIISNTLEASWL